MNVQQLSDLYEIQQLKARYFRFMDLQQWEAWRDLFTDDLEFYIEHTKVPEATTPTFSSADALHAFLSASDPSRITIHHGHMPDIEFVDDDNALGIWAMFDWVDDRGRDLAFKGYGHYHERYRRGSDRRWRICSVRLTRLRTNPIDPRPSERLPPFGPTGGPGR